MYMLISAGQGSLPKSIRIVLLGVISGLISSAVNAQNTHAHSTAMRHLAHNTTSSNRSTSVTRNKGKSTSKQQPGIMSPSNKLFPLMVVVIVAACFGAIALLAFLARRIMRRSHGQAEPEAIPPSNDVPEKRAKLRHATSWESDATLCDDDAKEEKTVRPPLRPMMSSVSRGTHGRFGSFSSTRSSSKLCEYAPEVPDKSEVTHETREKVLQNRVSVGSTDSGNTLYSLYDQVEKDQADALRENDLAKPCVTHAKKGWSIRPSNLDSIEDVSVELPAPRTLLS